MTVQNPGAKHSLGVGILQRCKITFEGSLGYFGLRADRRAGDPHQGPRRLVGVREHDVAASSSSTATPARSPGAAIRGGDLVIKGRVGARTGIDQKGGPILTLGSVGSMTGFMMQRGRQIICGDAGPGLGDSMYDGTIYVGGKVKSLGIDCVPGEWTDADTEFIERKFRIYGLGTPPELREVRVRQDALQLRQPRALRAQARALREGVSHG